MVLILFTIQNSISLILILSWILFSYFNFLKDSISIIFSIDSFNKSIVMSTINSEFIISVLTFNLSNVTEISLIIESHDRMIL